MTRRYFSAIAATCVALTLASCSEGDKQRIEIETGDITQPEVDITPIEPSLPELDEPTLEETEDVQETQDVDEAEATEAVEEAEAPAPEEGSGGPGDFIEAREDPGTTPSVIISPYYDYEPYQPSQEAPFEGIYPVADGDDGCRLEYRPVNAELNLAELGDDATTIPTLSTRMANETMELMGATPGPIEEDSDPTGQFPFWRTTGQTADGMGVVVSSRYEPVVGASSEIRGRGMDVIFTCPAGIDALDEYTMLLPFLDFEDLE